MGALTGLLAGGATLALLAALPDTPAIVLAAILLGLAAGVYPGVALGQEEGETVLQWTVAVGFAGIALAGLWVSRWILGLGWIAHGGWDLLHHRRLLRTRPAPWYPSACLVYDLILGAYVLVRWAI